MHHIITDGWSCGVFLRELSTLYAAFSTNQPSPLPELPIQYGDFTIWQRDRIQGQGERTGFLKPLLLKDSYTLDAFALIQFFIINNNLGLVYLSLVLKRLFFLTQYFIFSIKINIVII